MALEIMKLAIEATSTASTNPDVQRFFYNTTSALTGPTTLDIDAASFFDDTGAAVTTLPALETANSYFNVYINGVLQMAGLSTYTPGATGVGLLSITIPTGSSVLLASPVVLEIVNFIPDSSTTINT